MIALRAYAKLNLSLNVVGKRPDGYHNLDSVMQSISLHDVVALRKADYIHVSMSRSDVDDRHNTAFLAATAFCKHTGAAGADITVEKRIPAMAGLGGSSADAAAVLIGLNELYDTKLSRETLTRLGLSIGADVPFALIGGTARARGVGELLDSFTPRKPLFFVVVKPHGGVSTAQAFSRYRPGNGVRMDSVQYALRKGDLKLYHEFAGNVLGMAALSIEPGILGAFGALTDAGAQKALITGSGSSAFAVFETAAQAQTVFENVHGDFELCGMFTGKEMGVERIEGDYESIF